MGIGYSFDAFDYEIIFSNINNRMEISQGVIMKERVR
jgi:hypothetical protein